MADSLQAIGKQDLKESLSRAEDCALRAGRRHGYTETIQRESQENSPDHLRHGQARLSRWSDLRTVKTPAGAAASLRRN